MLGAAQAGLLAASSGEQPWLLTVQTSAPGQTYGVNIEGGVSPLVDVWWGDGTSDRYTTLGIKDHTYTAAGTYSLQIRARFASSGNIRFGDSGAELLKSTGAIPYIPGLSDASFMFRNCYGLTCSIPENLLWSNPQITHVDLMFYGCSGLQGSIPVNLFRYSPNVVSMGGVFSNCIGLTGSIPADLFRYNPLIGDFYGTFKNCIGLTGSIPADLFRYNTLVGSYGFADIFYSCIGLTGSIPADLFRYNTLVGSYGFENSFYFCYQLTSAPSLLFAYCPSCNSFSNVFFRCDKLQLPSDLFSASGDKSTRFLNKTVNFANAMSISTFTGTQGTAPDLWNYDFGSGTPTKTSCFTGHSSSSVSNYADIPAEWK